MESHVSVAGVQLIQRFESFRHEAYQDSGGRWTIGWGHTRGPKAAEGETITAEEGTELLIEDLKEAESGVRQWVDVPLNQYQYDALVSLVYNIGSGNFRGSSLLRYLNASEYERAAGHFYDWKKARVKQKDGTYKHKVQNGLIRRRSAEEQLFCTPPPVEFKMSKVVPFLPFMGATGKIQLLNSETGEPLAKELAESIMEEGGFTINVDFPQEVGESQLMLITPTIPVFTPGEDDRPRLLTPGGEEGPPTRQA